MIKNSIKRLAQSMLIVSALLLGTSAILAPQAMAARGGGLSMQEGAESAKGNDQGNDLQAIFRTVVNIMLFLIGAVAVIMLVVGGIRYVVSGGSQEQVQGAKNTIMYAIIGIVVAFLAYAAVQFVIENLQSGAGT